MIHHRATNGPTNVMHFSGTLPAGSAAYERLRRATFLALAIFRKVAECESHETVTVYLHQRVFGPRVTEIDICNDRGGESLMADHALATLAAFERLIDACDGVDNAEERAVATAQLRDLAKPGVG